jgi:hypothetical protein
MAHRTGILAVLVTLRWLDTSISLTWTAIALPTSSPQS